MRYRKVVKENDSVKATYDYVYSDGTLILLTYTKNGVQNTARFVYDSWGEPRGFMLNDSATYLYLKNAQGDITGIVDENGAVLLTYSYTAWGKVTFSATSMESMALAATLSNVNPFTYRGYCYDYDIGMYYLQSRYYDPQICRFINADSTDYLGATGTLLSYNLFAYCENDPVNRIDEDGRSWQDVKNALESIGAKIKKIYKRYKALTSTQCYNLIKSVKNNVSNVNSVLKLTKRVKKKLEDCKENIFQHVRDVVNIGYFEGKGKKGYIAIYRKSFGYKEDKLYSICYALYKSAWLVILASFDYDITDKKWKDLPDYCKQELLNTFPSWSKKIALNVGKYYSFDIAVDVVFTAAQVATSYK